jgi:acetate kinase
MNEKADTVVSGSRDRRRRASRAAAARNVYEVPDHGAERPAADEGAADTILVVNCGSSSVKFAAFAPGPALRRVWSGAVERIGVAGGRMTAANADGEHALCESQHFEDHEAALARLLRAVERRSSGLRISAVGHRVVHGGARCDCPARVTPQLERRLRDLEPLAPLHQPHNLAGIRAIRTLRPDLPQVACFDTAFHRQLPRLATLLPLPRTCADAGMRRYGFHGLSYQYVVDRLRSEGVDLARERIVAAHLGGGASMCAIRDGRSVDTTMGFSALGGLPMGTRSGDVDPGVVLYLLAEKGFTTERLQHLLYKESGLLGVSGISSDMRDLLSRSSDPAAREAVEYFCYQARRHLAALTAALGGLDRVVFTGGVGANAPEVRRRICGELGYLGITLAPERNAANERVVSSDAGPVVVDVFPTDEELTIARQTQGVLAAPDVA